MLDQGIRIDEPRSHRVIPRGRENVVTVGRKDGPGDSSVVAAQGDFFLAGEVPQTCTAVEGGGEELLRPWLECGPNFQDVISFQHYSGDPLHPNALGQEVMADAFLQFLPEPSQGLTMLLGIAALLRSKRRR